ncbi:MAG: SMP-30/gluconolactonase/LRE family protein [Actinomycetota bacterium]
MDDPAIARFAPVLTEITDGLDFPEGPVALPDGSVVVVEMFGEKLTRVTPDGGHETIADIPGGPNGAALGPEGEFYLCNNGGAFRPARLGDLTFPGGFDPSAYIGGRIQRVDVDGTVTDLYTECEGRPLRAPNDLVLDGHGGMWFTDHGIRDRAARTSDLSGLYWAALDGSEIREVVFPVEGPNGIGLSPSGDRLYWAETMNGRVHQRVVAGPGDLVRPEPLDPTAVLAGLPGNRYLDSLAVDGDGWVCVATIFDGGVTAISPDGTTIEHHATGDVITTNVCFGGADLATAFVTLSSTGRLVSMPWPRPGLRLAHQQL